jgi:putative acetyltransferase
MTPSPHRLSLAEMEQAARIHRAAFDDRLPWLAGLHTPEEDLAFYRDQVFATCELWGVSEAGALVGFIAFRPGWIEQLYVLPSVQRQGAGAALLAVAKAASPSLLLWTFQRNLPARRFYEAHGFRPIRETDGSDNEEREPDVLYRWQGEEPPL